VKLFWPEKMKEQLLKFNKCGPLKMAFHFAIAAALLFATRGLFADQFRMITLQEQVRSADCIVYGKVLSGSSKFESGRIYTYYRLSVIETLKGIPLSRSEMRVPGGIAGLVAYIVPGSPDFSPGEEVVLFLRNGSPGIFEMDGLTSGLYRLAADQGGQTYVLPNPAVQPEPVLSADRLIVPPDKPISLADFITAVYRCQNKPVDNSRYLFPVGPAGGETKRKAVVEGPRLSAGNVQAGYSRILGRPVDIFWDLDRNYGPVRDGQVQWWFDPDSIAGKSPYGVTPEQVLQAVQWSFAQWSTIPATRIKFQYAGQRRDIPNHKLDLVNMVTFADSEYVYGVQKEAIASAMPFVLARRTYVGPEGLDFDLDGRIDFPDFPQGIWEAGTIIDCDIRWDTGGPYSDNDYAVDNTPGALSMQGVFLHEFGHFSGLVHSPIRDLGNILTARNRTPTMFSIAVPNAADGSGNPMTSLEFDDLVSMSMLYPAPEFKSQYGSVKGSVISGINGKAVRGNFVVALSLPDGEPYSDLDDAYHRANIAIGVFSDQDGNFLIPGLPPGDYIIGLQPMDDIPVGTNRNAFNTLVSRFGDTDFIWNEFYNGIRESNQETNPFDYEPVTVSSGQVTSNIRFVTNFYPEGRISLRRLFGDRDFFVAANQLRIPFSPYSSTRDLVARKFPRIFAVPYKIVSATCDFASNTAPPEGALVVWPEIILALGDPQNPSRPDLANPLAVIKNFSGDGTLLTTDPLPFAYPVMVDRPGELWLVVRSPDRRLNAFHDIDILGAGQDELQVDESFVSFDNGASFASVMKYTVSWRMGVVLEGTSEKEPLAGPRLVQSERGSGSQAIKLHFARVMSSSGAEPKLPPQISLRYTYRAEPYPQGSLVQDVRADESTGALSFVLVRHRSRNDSTIYQVDDVLLNDNGRKLSGEVKVVSGSGETGHLDLERISGFNAGLYDGIWEGTLSSSSIPVAMDLVTAGSSARGAFIWPPEEPEAPDTSLVYCSQPGDTTVVIDSLPSNPSGFELIALDETGRRSPVSILGLGDDYFEPNDRLKDATPIFPARGLPELRHSLNSIRAVIASTKDYDDIDYFRFSVRQGDSVVVDVDAVSKRPFDPASSLDAYFDIYDSTGAIIKGLDGRDVLNDDENGLDPFYTFVSPRDVTCYLRLLQAAVAYGEKGELTGFNAFYELRVTILPRKGDVIRDQVIRVNDALAALEMVGKTQGLDPEAFFAADMNDDGRVDIADAGLVFRRALENPVARGVTLSSAGGEKRTEPVALQCFQKAPGLWVTAWEGAGEKPLGFMAEFQVSGPVTVKVPELLLSRLKVASNRQGDRLYVLGEFSPALEENVSAPEEILELVTGPEAGVSLISVITGSPGSGGQAALIESGFGRGRLPSGFSMEKNFPNPFNPSTTITYSVPPAAGAGIHQVSLEIFDIRGRLVRLLASGPHHPGTYSVVWDGRDGAANPLPSGVYIYRLRAENYSQTRKMVMIK